MTVSETANSNWELTIDVIDKVIAPAISASNKECQSTIMCDDFKGHSKKEVKMHMKEKYPTTNMLIMAGGITPKGQPLDKLVNKIFKGYFRDEYDSYILAAPINETTGHPKPPSRQLLAQWIVHSWEKIPEQLVKRSWEMCGYKSYESCQADLEASMVSRDSSMSQSDIVSVVQNTMGSNAVQHYLDSENEADYFDKEEI
jgi:hypothetical protein